MKKTAITILFTLFCYTLFAQDFTGIGIFKVGSDSTILYSYVKDQGLKTKDLWDHNKIENEKFKGKTFIRLHYKESEKYFMTLEKCPDVREYYLPFYTVDDIKLKNIRLLYYKSKLEKFVCDWNQDAVQAIEIKYGKINERDITDTSKCVYKLTGNERTLVTRIHIKEKYWNLTTLTISFAFTYDGECNETSISSITYELSDHERDACHWQSEYPQKPLNKDKLKDF
ncbi:MAG TPA: hypothetical protein VJ844_10030 [Mucilaginibacter sp.]|nr:hypothetical protein [Mucilaginibacter sp.]